MIPARKTAPKLFAHRGSGVLTPENTLPAFKLANQHNADVLETDVRISADHQVMVIHDAAVNRTTNGRGLVRDLNLHSLQALDAGFHAHDLQGNAFRNQGIRLLTLDELFDHFPGMAINVDIKDNNPQAARLVADSIKRCNRTENVTVGSFHSNLLVQFRQIAPEVKTSAIQREVAQLYVQHIGRPLQGVFPGISRPEGSKAYPSSQRMNYSSLQIPVSFKMIPLGTARFIEYAHNQGKEVCYWTVNKPSEMRRLLSLGADGIVTDRVDLARQVFDELGI